MISQVKTNSCSTTTKTPLPPTVRPSLLNEAAKRCDAFDDHIRNWSLKHAVAACSPSKGKFLLVANGAPRPCITFSSKSTDFIAERTQLRKVMKASAAPIHAPDQRNSENEVTTGGAAPLGKSSKGLRQNAHIVFKGNWYVTPINQVSSRRTMDVSCGGKLTKMVPILGNSDPHRNAPIKGKNGQNTFHHAAAGYRPAQLFTSRHRDRGKR